MSATLATRLKAYHDDAGEKSFLFDWISISSNYAGMKIRDFCTIIYMYSLNKSDNGESIVSMRLKITSIDCYICQLSLKLLGFFLLIILHSIRQKRNKNEDILILVLMEYR